MLLTAAAIALVPSPASDGASGVGAHGGDRPHSHVHAPGEIEESHGPLLFQIAYTGEIMGNLSGGRRRGARYLDNLDIVFEADLDRLAGWRGAQIHLYGLYNNGGSISDLAGDTQAVSNIETGVRALRLYEAWIDQKIGRDASLKVGLYDLNSEFDALDAAGLFVSSPHGIGTDFAQSGRNGPSIFPSTSLAARAEIRPAEGWAIRAALLDGVPGDPDRPGRTVVRLARGDGALAVGEVAAPLGKGKLLLGHWRYTAEFERNDGNERASGNAGSYVRAELPVIARDARRIDAFMRLGQASGRFNMFDRFAGGGLKFSGWVPARAEDEFGLAFAAAFVSESYRRLQHTKRAEVAIEATYRAQLASNFAIQPNVQYIRNPSADARLADAVVIGLRFEITHNFLGL